MESTASRLAATLSQIISTNCSQRPPVIIVACASEAASLPGPLRRCFTHELSAEAPDAAGRQMLLQVGLHVQTRSELDPAVSHCRPPRC